MAVLAVWAAWAAVTLFRAAGELRAGQRAAERVRGHLTADDIEGPGPTTALRTANRHFVAGRDLLGSRVVAPAWALPVAGRQLSALRDLSAAAADVTGVGASAAADARTALLAADEAGGDRVALLGRVADIAASARERLTAVRLPSDTALIGPVSSRRERFRTQLTDLLDALSRGGAASAALADLLHGPHRYLLLGANNAEMRAGSGMFLTAAVLETENGHVRIRDVQQTAGLHLEAEGVPYGGDMKARWEFAHPNREWRNLGLMPDFPENAELAVRMWEAQTGERTEGAIAVDAVAFANLLEYSGPVDGPAGPVTAANGLRFLLHDQYTIGDPASAERHEALGDIAGRVLGVLEAGKANVSMANALSRAVEGRHILVWSADPVQQARWEEAGAAGRMGARDVLVAVVNRGASKLDQFLAVSVQADVRPRGPQTDVVLRVSIRNDAPTGEPRYIAGDGKIVPEGTYSGILAVNVPGPTTGASIDGATSYAAIGPEGATSVLAVPVIIARGAGHETTVRFTVPTAVGWFRVMPSTRVPVVPWTVGAQQFSDARPKIVTIRR